MTTRTLKIIASILLFLISGHGFTQGGNPPPPMPPPPPGLPIDGGLIFLIIAALLFGIYKKLRLSKGY